MIIQKDAFVVGYKNAHRNAINLRLMLDKNCTNYKRLYVYLNVVIKLDGYSFEVIVSDESSEDTNQYTLNIFEHSDRIRPETDKYMGMCANVAWNFLKRQINQSMPKDFIYYDPMNS